VHEKSRPNGCKKKEEVGRKNMKMAEDNREHQIFISTPDPVQGSDYLKGAVA
jgi:hypothetical protein